jgi:hypothetical protein
MNKMMKVSSVVVSVMLAGSVCMADFRGDSHGARGRYEGGRSTRGHYDGGCSTRGHYDGGRDHGYYRNSRGDLVSGLIGLGMAAAIVSTIERPRVYVRPAPVVCSMPMVVQPREVVYVQQQSYIVQQPVQIEPPPPMAVTINIQNSNGSFTPVTLRQAGTQWVGPRGEYYDGVPSVGQLRPVYGF